MDPNPSEAPAGSETPVPSDADLLTAVRGGDDSAYDELYARHVAGARAAARSLVRSKSDAEDLVSEAFTRVLRAVRNGGGPELAFRPYLLTAVRNAFYDRSRKEARVEVTDEVPEDLDAVLNARAAMAGEDRELIARAFANLPERWQTVLWHTEVEGRPPAEVAPLLGIAPNAVTALAYRAREGLREAYLQAHLQIAPPAECAETRNRLGGYVRDSLSNRDRGKVDQHLDTCEKCRVVLLELREVSGSLRTALPLVLLGVPAVTYLHHLGAAGAKGLLAFFAGRSRGQQTAIGGGVAAAGVLVAVAVASALSGSSPPAPQVAGVAVASSSTAAAPSSAAPSSLGPSTTRAATSTSSSSTSTSTTVAVTSTAASVSPIVVTTASTAAATTSTTRAATTTTANASTTTSSTVARTTTTTIAKRAAVSVSGSALGPVVAGKTAYVSLVVANAGPDAAANTRLAFTLPTGLTYLGMKGDGWSCTSAGAAVTCARSTLAAGASSMVLVQARVEAGATGAPTFSVSAASDAVAVGSGSAVDVSLGAVEAAGPSPLFADVRRGDIATVGNTLRTCQGGCAAQNGAGDNGGLTMVAVDVDGDPSTTASSSSALDLPAGATVNRAWLVWGGTSASGPLGTTYGSVRLTDPSGGPARDYFAVTTAVTNGAEAVYGSVDVTGQVASGGAGTYTFASVDGFAEAPGTNRSGGWALVVQYDRPSDPLRTLVVVEGLVHIANGTENVALGVLGDVAPGGVNARVGLVAWDGDRGNTDSATLTSGATPTPVELADACNPVSDVFNSTVCVGGLAVGGRNPAYGNTLGFDADLYDVTVYGGGPLSLAVRSQGDAIELGIVTLSVPA